jgi:hypothetical protein
MRRKTTDSKKNAPNKKIKGCSKRSLLSKRRKRRRKRRTCSRRSLPSKRRKRHNRKKPQQEKPAVQHEQQAQRASGNHGRIPDDRYKANFGREHTFRVTQGDFNNHRFQYGGYWFGFAASWPSNWLYTQDVFVVDMAGVYYLCNPMYPGVNVELIVTL